MRRTFPVLARAYQSLHRLPNQGDYPAPARERTSRDLFYDGAAGCAGLAPAREPNGTRGMPLLYVSPAALSPVFAQEQMNEQQAETRTSSASLAYLG